jgi:hypothetical protein
VTSSLVAQAALMPWIDRAALCPSPHLEGAVGADARNRGGSKASESRRKLGGTQSALTTMAKAALIRAVGLVQNLIRSRALKVMPVVCAAGLATSAAAGAGFSDITGRVTGLPTNPLLSTVIVLNTHGAIAQIAPPASSGRYRFFLAPGTYLVAAGAASAASAGAHKAHLFLAVSNPVRVRFGKQSTTGLHLKTIKKATDASAAAQIPLEDAIVTVGNIPILDDRAAPTLVGGNVGFHTATILFDLCSRVGTRFVETSPEIVAREKQELALSRAGKLSTPFDFRPLKPGFAISGSLTVTPDTQPGAPPNSDQATFELDATRLGGGGTVVHTKFVDPQTMVGDPRALQGIVDGGAEKFAGAACGRGTPF